MAWLISAEIPGPLPLLPPTPPSLPDPHTVTLLSSHARSAGCVVISIAPALLMGCRVPRPDLLLVEHVEFRGQERAAPEVLRHLADIRNGDSMWTVDLDGAARGVRQHPWVRSAQAHREWPGTVRVEVEEYRPRALLMYEAPAAQHRQHGHPASPASRGEAGPPRAAGLYYVDEGGLPFLRAEPGDLDYPVITGVSAELERAHPELPRLVVQDALWLADRLDRTGLVDRACLAELAFSEQSGFTIVLTEGGAEIAFALADLPGQLDRLEALVRRGVDLRRPLTVDLAPSSVAIVRPRGAMSG